MIIKEVPSSVKECYKLLNQASPRHSLTAQNVYTGEYFTLTTTSVNERASSFGVLVGSLPYLDQVPYYAASGYVILPDCNKSGFKDCCTQWMSCLLLPNSCLHEFSNYGIYMSLVRVLMSCDVSTETREELKGFVEHLVSLGGLMSDENQ
jgi:hypothetical protein